MRRRKVNYKNRRNSPTKQTSGNKNSFLYLAISLGIFLLVELLNLSIVGTKGSELANIRYEQSEAEERIRLLESQISEATSLERIEVIAKEMLEMNEVEDVKYISEGNYISTANIE